MYRSFVLIATLHTGRTVANCNFHCLIPAQLSKLLPTLTSSGRCWRPTVQIGRPLLASEPILQMYVAKKRVGFLPSLLSKPIVKTWHRYPCRLRNYRHIQSPFCRCELNVISCVSMRGGCRPAVSSTRRQSHSRWSTISSSKHLDQLIQIKYLFIQMFEVSHVTRNPTKLIPALYLWCQNSKCGM